MTEQQLHQIFFKNTQYFLYSTPITYIFIPLSQPIQEKRFQQENFMNLNFESFKQVNQMAVQTEASFFQKDCIEKNQYQKSSELQESYTEFPLPDKQKLIELFENIPSKRKEIRKFISELCVKKTKTLNNFYISIGEKIISFKKTKEQIIKFLVRRAWKKQNDGADEARQKYYSEYKSMNSSYLSSIFSQSKFVKAYQLMLKNFDSDFDSYNAERFNRFYDYLLNCYVKNSLSNFKSSKQCKSKLPYPSSWRAQIKKIAVNLYENYCGESKDGEIVDKQEKLQKKKILMGKNRRIRKRAQ